MEIRRILMHKIARTRGSAAATRAGRRPIRDSWPTRVQPPVRTIIFQENPARKRRGVDWGRLLVSSNRKLGPAIRRP